MQEIDVRRLMEKLGRSGVTVLLKIDEERMAKGGEPWTLLMSGPGVGGLEYIRAESSSLGDCLEQGFAQLRTCPGDWDWLTEIA